MKKYFCCLLTAVTCFCNLFADEGMWMVNDLDKKTEKLIPAIVSYDFLGTGSLISENGLVITNHHVVYGDLAAMSTTQTNYLENGFAASSLQEEIPIKGRSVQILKQTIDVTDEVNALIAGGKVKKSPMMMRRLSGIMETKYSEQTGLTAILSSMWKGEKYYISLYENYSDVRLVAAPPSFIGAFGGDVDNWEWPQHKCDFSLVRIYTAPDGSPSRYDPSNVPLRSAVHLKISTKGYKEGTRTMVMGFPGKTDRYSPAAKVDFQTFVTRPVTVQIRGQIMDIITKWMNEDHSVRRKYADHFFGLSNAQELYLGEIQCYKRFDVAGDKRTQEYALDEWIQADGTRAERWGSLLKDLDRKYTAISNAQRNKQFFIECIATSSRLSPIATRTASLLKNPTRERALNVILSGRKDYSGMDMRVEREIFRYTLQAYMDNVDETFLGPYQKSLKKTFGRDYDAMCSHLWDGSWMTDSVKIANYLDKDWHMEGKLEELLQDNLTRYLNDVRITKFNDVVDAISAGESVSDLCREYTIALHRMKQDKGIRQYPDANSTMRITYGKVCSLSPRDAVFCDWKSTVAGLLEKHNPDEHDFCLGESWKKALSLTDGNMCVDFITDNDITGGNSGSPLMNSRGEILGLCFDGNKESLASDMSFTPDYNRCVNTDIRFVIWTLRNYLKLDNVLKEIGL